MDMDEVPGTWKAGRRRWRPWRVPDARLLCAVLTLCWGAVAACSPRAGEDESRPIEQPAATWEFASEPEIGAGAAGRQTARPPRGIDPYARQATSLLEQGRLAEALRASSEGLRRDSTVAALYTVRAAAYLQEGRYAEGVSDLKRLLELQPDDAVGWTNLGSVHAKLGQYDEARTALATAFTLAPERPSVSRQLARLHLQHAEYAQAYAAAQRTVDLDPEEPVAHFTLARAAEGLERPDEALSEYLEAARLDPSLAEAFYRAGGLALQLGSRAVADSAMAAHTRLQQLRGDPDVAKQFKKLRNAVNDSPETAAYHYALGDFLWRQAFRDEALNQFDRTLRLDARHYRALSRKGDVLAAQSQDRALALYKQALAIAPEYVPALIGAASIHMRANDPARAADLLRRVTAVAPQSSVAWYNLAVALLAAGERQPAVEALRAGGTAPMTPQLRQRFEQLEDRAAQLTGTGP